MSSWQTVMTQILPKLDMFILHDYEIVVSFLLNKQTRLRSLALANFITCLPREIPRKMAFIPSILERVQRWRVSLNCGVSGIKVAVKHLIPIDGP